MSRVFRPSMVVDFVLRFDSTLTLIDDPTAVSVATLAQTPPTGEGSAATPLLLRQGPKDVSFVYGRIPRSGSVELPGYRQAGTFDFKFDFRDLPIDPRTVSAASLKIHVGTVSDDDAAVASRGRTKGAWRTVIEPTDDNLLMVGTVDEWKISHSGSESIVSMRGRDPRGILLDTMLGGNPNDPASKGLGSQVVDALDMSQPLDIIVRQLLGLMGGLFADIEVVTNPSEWPNSQVAAPNPPDSVPRHRKGAKGKRRSARGGPNLDMDRVSVWDLIVRMSYLAAAIPFFRGEQLIIRPAKTIWDQSSQDVDPVKNPTPFAGGLARTQDASSKSAISPQLTWRRLVYGRDLESMEFVRKFGGAQRPKVIRVIGHDPKTEQNLVCLYPVDAVTKPIPTKISSGSPAAIEEIATYQIRGCTSKIQLAERAAGLYQEIGRSEIGGTFETKNLASFGGDNADPDLLRVRPGDGVELLVDASTQSGVAPRVSALATSESLSYEKQVLQVTKLLGDTSLARVVVATSRGLISQLQRFFRVSAVRYTWSLQGISVSGDFQNYVVLRENDPTLPPNGAAASQQVAGISSDSSSPMLGSFPKGS